MRESREAERKEIIDQIKMMANLEGKLVILTKFSIVLTMKVGVLL